VNTGSDDFKVGPAQRLSAHSRGVWAAEPRCVCMFSTACTVQLKTGSHQSPLCGIIDVLFFRKSDRPFRVDDALLYVRRTILGDHTGGGS
jgi:hypothetical protein